MIINQQVDSGTLVFLYRIIHKVTIKSGLEGEETCDYVTGRDERNTEESEDKLTLTLNQNPRRHAVFLKLYTKIRNTTFTLLLDIQLWLKFIICQEY